MPGRKTGGWAPSEGKKKQCADENQIKQSPHPLQGLATMDAYAVNDARTNGERNKQTALFMHMYR